MALRTLLPARRGTRTDRRWRDGQHPDRPRQHRSVQAALTLGAVGGLVAGMGFLGMNSWYADSLGQPQAGPLRTIATLVEGPPPQQAQVWVGVVVHVVLSIGFGVLLAALLRLPGAARAGGTVRLISGLLYGGALYLVDLQLLSRHVEHWSAFLESTNQPFQLAVHLLFGVLVAVFLLQPRATAHGQTSPGAR